MRTHGMFGRSAASRRWSPLLAAVAALVICGLAGAALLGGEAMAYRDAVGDQERGSSDITGFTVSDSRGLITLKVAIRRLSHTAVVYLDMNRDKRIDHSLLFWRGMTSKADIEAWRWAPNGNLTDAVPKIASASRRGDEYTFRFRAAAFGVNRAFGFEAHILGRALGEVTDWAPDDSQGWFTYRLTVR